MQTQVSNNPSDFHKVASKLRDFFAQEGLLEVHPQTRLSILAACEDPETIRTYDYNEQVWPLPQTGQMWLECELLTHKEQKGFSCLTTSYRNEPNPKPGRHEKIFPLMEFEMKGNMDNLIEFEKRLLTHLGYTKFAEITYEDACKRYGVTELEHEHEEMLCQELASVVFLKHFPAHTSPFWNMKMENGVSNKIDVLMSGMETIGSAERSTNKTEMRDMFNTISKGKYADILYRHFGKERVVEELDEFLSYEFFDRFGGGIGMTRLIRSMKLEGLL